MSVMSWGRRVFSTAAHRADVAFQAAENAAASKDHQQAVTFFFEAAKLGHVEAQYVLGLAYGEGLLGLPVNVGHAGHWMGLADAYAKAHPRLARGEQYGEKARHICEQARVAPDTPSAQQYFEMGLQAETKRELNRARKAYALAADRGHAQAANNLGMLYETTEDYKLALSCYYAAINLGHAEAMANLGDCHRLGRGVPKSFEQAVQWYSRAAQGGNAAGQYWLGMCALSGVGMGTNRDMALHWFRRASIQGYEKAQAKLKELGVEETAYFRANAGPMNRAEALEILDLKRDATVEDIKAAYGRLMRQVHPDAGGSNFFAKQLNAARATLLG